MSLNKWKAWPMENSEDVVKIEKKLMTTKRGSSDQFFAKINFLNPTKLNKYPEYLSKLLAYSCSKYQMYQVMWTVEIWLGTRQKSAHTNTTQMALYMCSSDIVPLLALFFLYFWVVVIFWDSFTFSFYFIFDIFCHLGA